eukprot:13319661-Alexandrium_andersonii.AAC.1
MPVVRRGGSAVPSPRVPAVGSAGLGASQADTAASLGCGCHEGDLAGAPGPGGGPLSLIHISEPTRLALI